MSNWIYPDFEFKPKRPLFLCIMSNTDTGKIPGISAAGTTPYLTDYTPGGDAELVETNKIMTMPELPEAPGGSPTPAIVTKAALNLSGIPSLFVASGLRMKPAVPFMEMGGAPATTSERRRQLRAWRASTRGQRWRARSSLSYPTASS